MEGDVRSVKVKGVLGCHTHNEPFYCAEVEVVPGASRRFVLMCPIKGCGNGFRITSRDCHEVHCTQVEEKT